ncbi:MAG: hypothetical protein D6738_04200, partial [Acidobacteria bacterium]
VAGELPALVRAARDEPARARRLAARLAAAFAGAVLARGAPQPVVRRWCARWLDGDRIGVAGSGKDTGEPGEILARAMPPVP